MNTSTDPVQQDPARAEADAEAAARKWRIKLIMGLLIVLFAAPLPLAWMLFKYTGLGHGDGQGAHGQLVVPPRPLPEVVLEDHSDGSTAPLRRKWSLVYLQRGACTTRCIEALHRMRQLRLAMGRNGTRVQRVLVVVDTPLRTIAEDIIHEYPGQLLVRDRAFGDADPLAPFRMEAGEDPVQGGRLYMVDPLGNLMMSYPADARPEGIIDDMERLLRYSSAG